MFVRVAMMVCIWMLVAAPAAANEYLDELFPEGIEPDRQRSRAVPDGPAVRSFPDVTLIAGVSHYGAGLYHAPGLDVGGRLHLHRNIALTLRTGVVFLGVEDVILSPLLAGLRVQAPINATTIAFGANYGAYIGFPFEPLTSLGFTLAVERHFSERVMGGLELGLDVASATGFMMPLPRVSLVVGYELW